MTIDAPSAYFDWNATAPLRPDAGQAMAAAQTILGNPSSVHAAGRKARAVLESARAAILASVNAPKHTLIFTSGGTEANNLGLSGLIAAAAAKASRITRLIVSALEHDCVLGCARHLADMVPGLRLTVVPATPDGIVCLDALRSALNDGKGRALVSLMFANNETGVLQPVAAAAQIAREHGALFHCDAVQAWGRVPIDASGLDADALTISAHKAGGGKGVGALILKEGVALAPQILGGGQEFGLRAGTQNIAAAAGFGAIATDLGLAQWAGLSARRDRLAAILLDAAPAARIYGVKVARLPNTICIGLSGVSAETQVMALDLDGVLVSAGAACSSGKFRPSHVLTAMGFGAAAAAEAIRISFGPSTSDDSFAQLARSWSQLTARTLARSPMPAA